MKTVRSLVLALALATGSAAIPGVSEALAADVFGAEGYVSVVPAAPLLGDGRTAASVRVLALNPDGTPMVGLRLKVAATTGTVGEWKELGGGLYELGFTPAEASEPADVTLSARGKAPATKAPVTLSGTVRVVPPATPVQAKTTPPVLTLGRDPEASITIVGPGSSLLWTSSAGTLENVTRMASGATTARFVPPKVNFPQLAILALADAADPLNRWVVHVVPLHGSVDYPVKADAGATVLLEIGDRTYGPVVADDAGKAKVPVEVPPGVSKATQVSVKDGQEKREEIDLRIPATRRIQLLPLPGALAADPGAPVPLRVAIRQPNGTPDTNATPKFTVDQGTVAEARHVGDGVYEATWTPSSSVGTASVSVVLGEGDLNKDQLQVELVGRRPATMTVAATSVKAEGGAKIELVATAKDAAGAPLVGGVLGVGAAGAEVAGDVVAGDDGTYKVTLQPKGGAGRAQVWLDTGRSRSPAASVVLVPATPSLISDGTTRVDLLVAAVDAQGLPVPSQKVTLKATHGGAALLNGEVTTGPTGFARVTMVPGKEPGLAAIEASAGPATGRVVMLQLPAGVAPVALGADAGVGAKVAAGVASVALEGGPAATTPAPAPDTSTATRPAAVVSLVDLSASPSTATPGAVIEITGSSLDATGQVTPAHAPTITASTGSVSDPVVTDGKVVVKLTVPEGATGPIVITGSAGGRSDTLTLPIEGAKEPEGEGPWGSTEPEPEPVAAAEPEPVVETPPAPKPADDGEYRWLRARASGIGSTYRYEQLPSENPGPLIPAPLSVGGPNGGSAASPAGGEIDVRAWGDALGDGLEYVGVHGQVRGTSYGIEADAFSGVAKDVLYNVELDLLGRYAFESAGDRYWVGGKAGVHYNDFLLFTGCLEPGCTVLFEPVGVTGLGLGAELGAEIADLYLVGGYTLGLARFSQPYSNAVDVNLGYGFHENVFADLGFSVLSRAVVLQGADSGLDRGEIDDSQMMIKLGVGFSL